MKLYLLQHGEAVPEEMDPQRPLSDKGASDIEKLARYIASMGVQSGQVFHSGKLRARQTAEIISKYIAQGSSDSKDGLKPNDDVIAFTDELDNCDSDLCVVGHLPFMSKLVSYLVTTDVDQAIVHYLPGTMVCLERDELDQWQINWMLRPEMMTD